MADIIVDLETDMETSPELLAMLVEDYDCVILYSTLVRYKWFKARDVTKPEDEQVIEMLSADRSDPTRIWSCSPTYADNLLHSLRYKHHNLECERVYMYSRVKDTPSIVFQYFRDIGWEAIHKTANDRN